MGGLRYVGPSYDFTQPGLLNRQTTADPLFQWRRNYAKRQNRVVNIGVLGDSIPFGQGITVGTTPDRTNSADYMTRQLQRILNGVPGYNERNWVDDAVGTITTYQNPMQGGYALRLRHVQAGGFADPWKLVSGSVTYPSRGLGLSSIQLAAGTRISYTAESSTGFAWWYENGVSQIGSVNATAYAGDYSAAPTAYYSNNGASPVNTGLAQYERSFVAWELPRGKWTFELSVNTGTPVVDMVYVFDGDWSRGVRVYNLAHGGIGSADLMANNTQANTAATNAPKLELFDTGRGVDLYVLYVGAGDYSGGVSGATFQANLEAIIDKYRAAQTRVPAFLLVSHFARYDNVSPTVPWSTYKAAMKAVTKTRAQTDYIDLENWFPVSQAADTDDDLVDSSGVHLTNQGQGLAAQLIAEKLMFAEVM
jgi:lysophospholipase L1-like esterase